MSEVIDAKVKVKEANETQQFQLDEVTAEVSVGKVTTNIAKVYDQAVLIRDHYAKLVITEDMLPQAMEEKVNVNKAKDAVATYRKDIVAKYKAPINEFEETAKKTEKVLKEAYDCINATVQAYENETKKKKAEEVKQYFDEYAESLNIDFVQFEQSGIDVGLTGTVTSYKKKAKGFLDNILNDLNLINTQQDTIEILAEYKRTLNVSQAIMDVKARKEAEARERERQEILAKAKVEQEAQIKKVEEAVSEVTAPVEIVQEEILSMKIKIYGTIDQLREVKHFLEEKGIRYDTDK